MTATELINQLEMTPEEMIKPISEMFRSNLINAEQFFNLIDHITKISNRSFDKGYWKAIQITSGDEFVLNVLGDGRTKGE